MLCAILITILSLITIVSVIAAVQVMRDADDGVLRDKLNREMERQIRRKNNG